MAKNHKFLGLLATFMVVTGLIAANPAFGASDATERSVVPQSQSAASFEWRRLGGDPYQANVTSLPAYKALIRGPKGLEAARKMGISPSCWQALIDAPARRGVMRYGDRFAKMIFGVNGIVVRNVVFRDPRFRGGGAASWVSSAVCGGKVVTIVTPMICGNIAIKFTPKPKPMTAPVVIVKVAEDAAGHVIPTPTNTFYFTVTTTGKVTSVRYDQDPQPAGRCRVGSIVLIWEDVPAGWELFSPRNNPQTFVCQKGKGVRAVFKNRQLPVPAPKPPAPPAPQPPVPQPPAPQPPPPPPPPPPPAPPARSCLITPVEGKDGMVWNVMLGVSHPGDGPQGTISWGDGATSPGMEGQHTYSAEGSYTISATVTFQQGGSASCSTTVVVRRKSAPSPP